MKAKNQTRTQQLIIIVGNSIEEYVKLNPTITHIEIIEAMEALRHEFTEDLILQFPEQMRNLH